MGIDVLLLRNILQSAMFRNDTQVVPYEGCDVLFVGKGFIPSASPRKLTLKPSPVGEGGPLAVDEELLQEFFSKASHLW